MRPIKELLQAAIEDLPSYWMMPLPDRYPQRKVDGLCLAVDFFDFSPDEIDVFLLYLEENLPKRRILDYCWPPGMMEYRLEWLKKQLKNEKQKNN